jgi:hypothetical protein
MRFLCRLLELCARLSSRPARPRTNSTRLELEELEGRRLLAWSPIGPAPLLNSQSDLTGAVNEAVTGRVTAVAIGQTNAGQPALFLGAAAGGIWRSTDFTGANPTWTPLTDLVGRTVPVGPDIDPVTGLGAGAIDVGAIAVDPGHPNVIYVGTGEGDYSGTARYGSGILKSTDGGDHFQLISSGPAIAADGGSGAAP